MPDLQYIERVATLCKKYSELQFEISEIKKVISNPLNADCDIRFTIDIHNKKQHEENVATKQLEALFEDPILGVLRAHYNVPEGVNIKGKACHHRMIFHCSEATSIIILTALLREKESKRERVLEEFHQLQHLNNKSPHISNPIIDLHETKP